MPAFDVFLSHSRADRDVVERLGRALRDRGLTVFVDRWYLVAGQSWPETLEKYLRDCRAVAVCIGASGMGAWQQREHYEALDRQAHEPGFPVIPVLLPGADDPALGFLGLNTWVDLRQSPDDGVTIEILARAARGLPPGDEAALVPDPRAAICPYRGLLPFSIPSPAISSASSGAPIASSSSSINGRNSMRKQRASTTGGAFST